MALSWNARVIRGCKGNLFAQNPSFNLDRRKELVGKYAADLVTNGMKVGIGSGTTVSWLIQALGERVKEGLEFTAVPTSSQTFKLAKEAGISLSDLDSIDQLDLAIDGADEIDPVGNLIKGGGGALLQEKIVAAAARKLIVIADDSKLVTQLGMFPLPVEVVTFGYKQVQDKIIATGICKDVRLRLKQGEIFVTDHGHFILDCHCKKIEDAPALNVALHLMPGVVETGLFIGMTNTVIVAKENGEIAGVDF